MAWRLSAWHGTHPYDSVAFFFFLFLLSLFSSHSSIPSIHPIPSHPIPSALIQQRLALFRLHLPRLFILASPSTFFQVPKELCLLLSNHSDLTLLSLSSLSSGNGDDRQTVVTAIVAAAAAATVVVTLTHAMTSIKS